MQLFNAMISIIQGCQVVGCDLVELSPMLDASGASTATALKVLREMLLGLEKPFIKPVQI
jgi:agmatinase